ncbi:MAG: hypothetical protein WBG90_05180, partial [Saonia sp.]
MTTKNIPHLIIKYVSKSANATELDELDDWLQNEANQTVFKDFVKSHYEITLGMDSSDPTEIKEYLLNKIRKDKKQLRVQRTLQVFKYAATLLLLIGAIYFLDEYVGEKETTPVAYPTKETITLQLDNGHIEIIPEEGTSEILNSKGKVVGKQTGKMLIYNTKEDIDELVYNTLNVPYGKQFELLLSDGTTVHLNAGSTLRYPVKFIQGKERQVYLTGE